MNRVDWQAYLDGSLSGTDREAAESMLAEDPGARAELEGLKAFRTAIRLAASEEAPIGALEGALQRTVFGASETKAPRTRRIWAWPVAAAAAAAILFFLFRGPTISSGEIGSLATADAVAAARWAKDRVGIASPAVSLAGMGRLELVHCGRGWACFDYVVDGQRFHLYVTPAKGDWAGCEEREVGGRRYYVGDDVGWTAGTLAFRVKGGTEELRLRIAEQAANEIDAQLL